ncbi:MAG: hypothetical protein ACLT98_16710 [Eggerthellaceae bacterium]
MNKVVKTEIYDSASDKPVKTRLTLSTRITSRRSRRRSLRS